MSEKWWERYEWWQVQHGHRPHAMLPDMCVTACGIGAYDRWIEPTALPRCKTCERSIEAARKRCEGVAP